MPDVAKYIAYLDQDNQEITQWLKTVVVSRIRKHGEAQGEIEHIIDYLKSDAAPKHLRKMSYLQAKTNAEKWVTSLQKKGADILEGPEDTETVLDFCDGMKFVRLIGDNAFKREGFLMSHCVASYSGRDTIYSLRDKNNQPHCTIEWGNQIKGKGNGPIHPKYIDYVVGFLENQGMPIRDSEMENLGYVKVTSDQKNFILQHFPNAKFYKDSFLFMDSVS